MPPIETGGGIKSTWNLYFHQSRMWSSKWPSKHDIRTYMKSAVLTNLNCDFHQSKLWSSQWPSKHETRDPSGPEITHLDPADHDMLHCVMVAILDSNPESDAVWRVSRLPLWAPSWILELNDLANLNTHIFPMPPIKFRLNLTYCLGC